MSMSFKERFVKSRLRLLTNSPFFGTLLLHSSYKLVDFIPTAATDGKKLLFNEEFMMGRPQQEFEAILLHEVLHMALQHVSRMRKEFLVDPQIANIAADIVVNGIIDDNSSNSRGVYLRLPDGAVRDNSLKHLSVREIYSILKNMKEESAKEFDKRFGSGANECLLNPAESGRGEGQDSDEEENEGGEGQSGKSQPAEVDWKDVLNKAAVIAKTRSFGPQGAGIERIFKEFLEPTIDWRDSIYKYATAAKTDFESFDRRFIHRGLYLDDLGGESINIIAFIDASGSVDNTLLQEFFSELKFAVNALPRTTGEIWSFDTENYRIGDISELESIPKIRGGGGTSFFPAIEYLKKQQQESLNTQTLGIIFTDGHANLDIEDPEVPVLWCISPGGVESEAFKFGEVIRITR